MASLFRRKITIRWRSYNTQYLAQIGLILRLISRNLEGEDEHRQLSCIFDVLYGDGVLVSKGSCFGVR